MPITGGCLKNMIDAHFLEVRSGDAHSNTDKAYRYNTMYGIISKHNSIYVNKKQYTFCKHTQTKGQT